MDQDLNKLTDQEKFWKDVIGNNYINDNDNFDKLLAKKAWIKMLQNIDLSEVNSILECGANIGRNLDTLQNLIPQANISVIEINANAIQVLKERYKVDSIFEGSIKDAHFENNFDLVFTSGVLIHINPNDLLSTLKKMFELSSRYILIAEYFNRTPVTIEYRGFSNMLFKMDFGKLFSENFACSLVDYGFLWGHIYDEGGFDDITWWMFEKKI